MDLDITRRVPSPKPTPEVDFRPHGRQLEKSIWRHNSARVVPFGWIW